MQSVETESKLAQLILSIAEAERSVEVARQVLCEHSDFEPYSAFRKMDRLNQGYLTVDDLDEFLRRNTVPCTIRDVNNLLKLYDTNKNGRLSYTEFMNAALTATNITLRNLATQRASIPAYLFPYDVEVSLARVFQRELDSMRNLELTKQELVNRYDFNLLDAFRLIDTNHSGYITVQEMTAFLRRNGYLPYDEDISDILRRFDKDGDQMISYMEFVETILPTEPYEKVYPEKTLYSEKSLQYTAPPVAPTYVSTYSKYRPDHHDISYYDPQYYKYRQWDPYWWKRSLDDYNYWRSLRLRQKIREDQEQLQQTLSSSPSRRAAAYTSAYSPSRARAYSPVRQSYNVDTLRYSRLERSVSPVKRKHFYESPTKRSALKYESPRKYESPSKAAILITPEKQQRSPYRQRSPAKRIAYVSEEEMVRVFQQQIQLDRELELLRQDLSLRADFNLMDAFKYFDLTSKNYLTDRDVERTLADLGVYPTMEELDLFFRRYDLDNDARLRYSDFCEIFTPKQTEYAKLMSNRAALSATQVVKEQGKYVFSLETQTVLTKMLRMHLEVELNSEKMRQRLSRNVDFNSHDVFLSLDKNGNGFVTLDELRQALQEHGVYPTERELIGLISRYDKNKDGRVSYSEFMQEITPKSAKPLA